MDQTLSDDETLRVLRAYAPIDLELLAAQLFLSPSGARKRLRKLRDLGFDVSVETERRVVVRIHE